MRHPASEVDAWLVATLEAWRRNPSSLVPVTPGDPSPNGFVCGPEVWGEGLVDGPPGSWPPRN
jgi:hypothetical protein